jgi:hypothetical protein
MKPRRPWSVHTSAYVSIRQHTSAYVSIRSHTSQHKNETEAALERARAQVLSLLALLVQKYKY